MQIARQTPLSTESLVKAGWHTKTIPEIFDALHVSFDVLIK